MGRRDDKLQWKLYALLIPIIAGLFVLAMGDLRFWFTGLVVGLVLGFLASGAIVWFRTDVLKRSLDDRPQPEFHPGANAELSPHLDKAARYLATCGKLTKAKALRSLRIGRRMDLKQTLLNTWATHKPNEVRDFLRDQFAATTHEPGAGAQPTTLSPRPDESLPG